MSTVMTGQFPVEGVSGKLLLIICCPVVFVLLLYLMDLVQYCNRLVGKEGDNCFAFLLYAFCLS